jgi:N-ethylmaleimide reductase
MNNAKLLNPYKMGSAELKNRIVMAPMTRSRAVGNIPNQLMAEYYEQRAEAGLIITEGTTPSPHGFSYCHIPGIYSDEQVEGWKKITDAVHLKDGKIFVQLIHIGRISHHANIQEPAVIVAPSAIKPIGQIWYDSYEIKNFPIPAEIVMEVIEYTKQEYISAAQKAINAGFDGIELHADNYYMIEQFLSSGSRLRKDNNIGADKSRCIFLLEVLKDIIKAIGKDKVGLCLSPYCISRGMSNYHEIVETYSYLAKKLNNLGVLYIHLVDPNITGAEELPVEIKSIIRNKFEHTLIFSGKYTMQSAEEEIESGFANLIAFGRPFINNPDLVQRFTNGWQLSKEIDMSTFYSTGGKGYTDYPVYSQLSN